MATQGHPICATLYASPNWAKKQVRFVEGSTATGRAGEPQVELRGIFQPGEIPESWELRGLVLRARGEART